MFKMSWLLILVFTIGTNFTFSQIIPILLNGNLNELIPLNVNKSVQYIIDYDTIETTYPLRVLVESTNAKAVAPLMVVVKQTKEILSWKLPLVVDSETGGQEFMKSGRTLCHDNTGGDMSLLYSAKITNTSVNNSMQEKPIISVSTASITNVSATVRLVTEDDFYLKPSLEYSVTISPSSPRFYFYNFPNTTIIDNYETVLLMISSNDSICMTVSIQNSSCPVYDLNNDITFEGYYETVNEKGGITISKSKFPHGFFLVFVAKGDDYDCMDDTNYISNRTQNLTFSINPSIMYKDYVNAVLATLACIAMFYAVFGVSFFMCSNRTYVPRTMDYVSEANTPSSAVNAEAMEDDTSIDETEYDTIAESEHERNIILGKPVIFLSDLARKDSRILMKKSYSYLWHVLTVALFYFLPVVQLVITYQKVLNDTGNQDLCYYNFLCAHPVGFFSDFNHIFSNIGYVLFGLLFLWITYRREKWHQDVVFDRHYGIPQHYGMFYAMGVALIMEGVLSGSYHICPNHANFQFDTSFMYVTAVLCMIKIYQTRHPDINATAYTTFGVLAIAILLGMIGILEANLYFWIGFTVLHILTCFYLTVQIYYMGCYRFDRGVFLRVYRVICHDFLSGPLNVLRPMYKGRMVLLIIGNLLNWALAAVGIYYQHHFALYLLGMFMMNTIYYFTFYIIMKLLHKESINSLSLLFLVISLTCAVTSFYSFFHRTISWSLTPAGSRTFNQSCVLMRFYDYHDIWHFLSAVGMFFMFMCLLTLDDDLSHVLRSKIPVF